MSETIQTKRCSKCKDFKQLSEYSKNKDRKDGLQGWCKSCKNAHQKKYQQTPNGKIANRKGAAKYRRSPNGKAYLKAYPQSGKGKVAHHKSVAKHRARNPNYAKANHAVNDAIRAGKLPRPDSFQCPYCPGPAQEYHHHKGYEPEHWLDVVPVCKKCHSKCNRKIA